MFFTGTSHIHFSAERVNKIRLDTSISIFLLKNIWKILLSSKKYQNLNFIKKVWKYWLQPQHFVVWVRGGLITAKRERWICMFWVVEKGKQKQEPHEFHNAQLAFLLSTLHSAVFRVQPCSSGPPCATLSSTAMATPKGEELALLFFNASNEEGDRWTCTASEDEIVQSSLGYTTLCANENNDHKDLIRLCVQSSSAQPTALMQSMSYPAKTRAALAWLEWVVQALLPFSFCEQNVIRRSFWQMSVSMDSLMLYLSRVTAVVGARFATGFRSAFPSLLTGKAGAIHITWPCSLRSRPGIHRRVRQFCSRWRLQATRTHRPPRTISHFWSLCSPSSERRSTMSCLWLGKMRTLVSLLVDASDRPSWSFIATGSI